MHVDLVGEQVRLSSIASLLNMWSSIIDNQKNEKKKNIIMSSNHRNSRHHHHHRQTSSIVIKNPPSSLPPQATKPIKTPHLPLLHAPLLLLRVLRLALIRAQQGQVARQAARLVAADASGSGKQLDWDGETHGKVWWKQSYKPPILEWLMPSYAIYFWWNMGFHHVSIHGMNDYSEKTKVDGNA